MPGFLKVLKIMCACLPQAIAYFITYYAMQCSNFDLRIMYNVTVLLEYIHLYRSSIQVYLLSVLLEYMDLE